MSQTSRSSEAATTRGGLPAGSAAPPSRDTAGTARVFLERSAPEGYLDEWARRLAEPEEQVDPNLLSIAIFRLNDEWLALPTGWLVEITDPQPIHTIPHRTDDVLLGLVNIRGQLRLCVSLHGLLGVDPPAHGEPPVALAVEGGGILRTPYPRMIILRDGLEEWVFTAEEVLRVDLLPRDELRKPPSTFLPTSTHTQSVFDYHGRTVGLLDALSLFPALRSHCQ